VSVQRCLQSRYDERTLVELGSVTRHSHVGTSYSNMACCAAHFYEEEYFNVVMIILLG
jgi:hypothetical protein